MAKSIYEVVAKANGYTIDRLKGSQRFYNLRIDDHRYMTFHTKKAAIEQANKMRGK